MNCVHRLLINSMVLFKDGFQRNLYTLDISTLRANTLAFLLTQINRNISNNVFRS